MSNLAHNNVIQMPTSDKQKAAIRKARYWEKLKADLVRLAQHNAKKNARYQVIPEDKDGRKKVVLIENGRVCSICNVGKSWDDFAVDKHGYNGKTSRCRECRSHDHATRYRDKPHTRRSGIKNRDDKLKRLYGITYADAVRTLDHQHGRCANMSCGKEIFLDIPVSSSRAVIDHDHKTGKFRSMLCVGCNTLCGKIENSQHVIDGLMTYLHKHRST